MHNIYIKFKDNDFVSFDIQTLPAAFELTENEIIITDKQHDEYLTAINQQSKKINLINGKIVITNKYTDDETKTMQAEATKLALIAKARALLNDSDFMVLPDKFIQWDKSKQDIVIVYRQALRDVVNEKSVIIPELPVIEG